MDANSRDENRTLRAGLIGYGLAGSVFHAPLIAAADGLALDTVVTASPERQQQARDEHPGVRIAASADELWARAGELDLIVIASPNRTHVPLAHPPPRPARRPRPRGGVPGVREKAAGRDRRRGRGAGRARRDLRAAAEC